MKSKKYKDEELVEMIRLVESKRKEALKYIYVTWQPDAIAIMRSAGAVKQDAEDAIQEAIVVLDNHVRSGRYEPIGKLKNYFISICKGRLRSNKRSTKRIEWTDDNFKMDAIETRQPETLMLEQEQKSIVQKMLKMLDSTCREVLKLYRLSYSNTEIAELVGLGNANNARQRVFQCRKRLSELIAKHPLFINYFKNRV